MSLPVKYRKALPRKNLRHLQDLMLPQKGRSVLPSQVLPFLYTQGMHKGAHITIVQHCFFPLTSLDASGYVRFSLPPALLCRSILIYYKYIHTALCKINSRTVSKTYLEPRASSDQNSSLIVKTNNQENQYEVALKQIVLKLQPRNMLSSR